MDKKKKQQIIKLLKSGNFTIAGHDSGMFCLYRGKIKYEDLPEHGEIYTFEDWSGDSDGYITEIIGVLVEALGGITNSI